MSAGARMPCPGAPLRYLACHVFLLVGAGMRQGRQGVLFVAIGADYLDLARDAAASVRASNPALPIDLFTDQPHAPGDPFDRVRPAAGDPKAAKIASLAASRFERTLFLDCDTRVVRAVDEVFRILDRFDLALAHDVRRASGLIRSGWRVETPYAFPQHNSGVLLYRRSPAMSAFLKAWLAAFREAGADRDQVTLRDLLWSSDLRYYVLPPEFNLRRMTMLDAWEPLDAIPTIFHSHIFLQHLRRPGAPRIRDIEEVIEIERENHRQEWLAAAISGPRTEAWPLPPTRPSDGRITASRIAAEPEPQDLRRARIDAAGALRERPDDA